MTYIQNGEQWGTTRGKINKVLKISNTDLLADTTLTYTADVTGSVNAGDLFGTTEGQWFEVAASDASDQHQTTAGGVKLYEAGPNFSLRSRLVAAHARNVAAGRTVPGGTVWSWPDFSVVLMPADHAAYGTDPIADLAGWAPFGDVYPDHWDENTTPGTTDMTAACQAAVDYAGYLFLGNDDETYSVSRLTLPSEARVYGKGKLDFSNNASYATDVDDPLILAEGSAGSAVAVSADISEGDTVITVASTSGIAEGDLIEIGTPGDNGGWVDSSVAVHNAEICRVESVDSGTQLTLAEPVVDENGFATADSAQIRLLTTVDNIRIEDGVKIVGKGRPSSGPGDFGVVIFYGRNIKIHAEFIDVDYSAIRFESCYNVEFSGGRIEHPQKGSNSTVNYGCVPSGSTKYCRIFNNKFLNMRHGVVTSHLSSALGLNMLGVSRFVEVYDNTFTNTWHAAAATHSDTDMISITDNVFVGCTFGVNTRDRRVRVCGNKFHDCRQDIYVTKSPLDLTISDNQSYGGLGSFLFFDPDNTRAIEKISITDNVVRPSTESDGGIALSLSGASAVSRVLIAANVISGLSVDSVNEAAIRVTGLSVSRLRITGNTVDGVSTGRGITVENGGDDVLITDNEVRNVTGAAYTTLGTFTDSYAWRNVSADNGSFWSGNSNLTNSAAITAWADTGGAVALLGSSGEGIIVDADGNPIIERDDPTLWVKSTSTGESALTGTSANGGLLMTANNMNTTSKYTPAVMFGSTDDNLTTTNPKVGAAIAGVALETYAGDIDGAMGLALFTTPIDPGTAEAMVEVARFDEAGNFGVGTGNPDYLAHFAGEIGFAPGSSVTPVSNGDVVFELTSNTTLTIKAKGSDGVVRSGTVTLA